MAGICHGNSSHWHMYQVKIVCSKHSLPSANVLLGYNKVGDDSIWAKLCLYNSLLQLPKTAWLLSGERQHPHRFLMWSFCHIYNTEDVNLKKILIWGFFTSASVWGMMVPPKYNLSFRHIFSVVLSMTLLPVKPLSESVLSIRIKPWR